MLLNQTGIVRIHRPKDKVTDMGVLLSKYKCLRSNFNSMPAVFHVWLTTCSFLTISFSLLSEHWSGFIMELDVEA